MSTVLRYPPCWMAHFAVAKTPKFGVTQSGDTVELIERPDGGFSVVLADGQRSGPAAKAVANMVVRRVIALLAEGVRDGAAARAASDALFAARQGKVQATLNILSVDMAAHSLVVVRNNPAPVFVVRAGGLERLDEPAEPVGLRRYIRPVVREYPLESDTHILAFTDGFVHAGERFGQPWDPAQAFLEALRAHPDNPQAVVDTLLHRALVRERGLPADDITLVLVSIGQKPAGDEPPIRRLYAQVALP